MANIYKIREILSNYEANPDHYRGKNFPKGSTEEAFVLSINKQIDSLRAGVPAEVLPTLDPKATDEQKAAAILEASNQAVSAHIAYLKQNIEASNNNEPTAPPPEATGSVIDGALKNAVSGVVSGGGFISGLISGVKSGITGLIFSIPSVGKFMEQVTTYITGMWNGDNTSWEDAGKIVESSRASARMSEATGIDPSAINNLISSPSKTTQGFERYDADGNGELSQKELSSLDSNGDKKIKIEEIPEELKPDFARLIATQSQPSANNNTVTEIDLGSFKPIQISALKNTAEHSAAK